MADLFVGPVMEKLIDACFNYLKDQARWQTGMKEELERLRKIHPDIQDVVSAYNKAHIKDPDGRLHRWLWNLRDAIDEADDVLDTFQYRKHEKEVSKNKKVGKVRSIIKKGVKRALKIDPDLKKLEEAVQKLEKVSAEVSDFHHLLKSTEKEQQKWHLELEASRETGSSPTDVVFLGRSDDMKFVVQWLTTPISNEHEPQITGTIPYRNISLLSVVGHGGMGKTSLLQHVCKLGMTEKEFDPMIWVCVSNEFNAVKVIKGMLESIEKERPRADGLDALQRSLGSAVKSKKFLLVLDDIWEDNDETEWGKVLAPLADGSLGSKILVTTRMESAASTIAKVIGKDKEILQLKGLEEDECLQLLIRHAFAGVKNPDEHQKLRSIAEEMAKKISGSPLAAKVIGGALNSKLDDRYWRNILNSDIGNVEPGQNKLLPILKLSYIYLPKELHNCFAFCSIFPQDHEFDKDDLVRMWIALGFIQSPSIQGETMEDIGQRYFDILVKKSFFEEVQNAYKEHYKMHDLLHELAQFVSKQECFRIVDDKKLLIPETIRHLSIWSINAYTLEVLQNLEKFKHLRSLFLSSSYANLMDVLPKVFNATRSIRLLFISFPYDFPGKIPETIDYLSHLRYLKFSVVFPLPGSISHLYHLQFIICEYCLIVYDEFVPKNFNNLYNLRYLELPLIEEERIVHEIGKLKSLQKLEQFYVSDKIGYRIGELEHMNELRQLKICQLKNIKDAEEACSAKLCDKSSLTDLSLKWGFRDRVITADSELDEMVLENIQPPNNLKKLIIDAYMGVRSARWMNNVHLTNLEHIKLYSCFNWETLPPFGQLPFLKYLHLHHLSEVKRLNNNKDCVFPSLQELHIEDLPALQEWFDTKVAEENVYLFRCLTKLYLSYCPKLQQLPSLPPKLQELTLIHVEWNCLNLLKGISSCCEIEIRTNLVYLCGRQELKDNENCQLILNDLVINDPSMLLMEPLRSITSLEELQIEENDETVSFPIEAEGWFLQVSSSLRVLKFESLKSLQTIPSSIESLASLENLYVLDVPQPQLLPNLPHSLIKLELKDLDSLQCLPSSLSTNSYLTHLQLTNIPLLKSLPNLPSSLLRLNLEELKSLQCLPSSLSAISSLEHLLLKSIPLLESLPDLPSLLELLSLQELESLQCLPSSLSAISSLKDLHLESIPLLKSLPDLPSLEILNLKELESLQCLPSSLSAISSLKNLRLESIPLLKSLTDLPFSLELLRLKKLESLICLPSSLLAFSSLKNLHLKSIPLLKSLPDLPSSLVFLDLKELQNLDCLPSCLPDLSSLDRLEIKKVPQLRELPDLPASLEYVSIKNCHPELNERYEDEDSF